MRLFVGIPLDDTVVSELGAVCDRLRSNTDGLRWAGLRWSGPESWHITLQFLGNTSPEQYACLSARLRAVHAPPVPIHLGELGFFDRAGIFFAGVELTPQLISLEQRVTEATAGCGFVSEDRAFHPHITLARSKGQGRGRPFAALKKRIEERIGHQPRFSRFTAQEFILYESHLGPAGSRYEIRARFPLGS
jgi:2'-5' RNA ligase